MGHVLGQILILGTHLVIQYHICQSKPYGFVGTSLIGRSNFDLKYDLLLGVVRFPMQQHRKKEGKCRDLNLIRLQFCQLLVPTFD